MKVRSIVHRALVVCFVFTVLLCAMSLSDSAQPKRIAELTAELDRINKDTATVQDEIKAKNAEFFKFQHDTVYTNAAAATLYQEIKALEKSINEKRKELAVLTHELPAMRTMIKERDAVYKRLRYLNNRSRLVQNEIEALTFALKTKTENDNEQ